MSSLAEAVKGWPTPLLLTLLAIGATPARPSAPLPLRRGPGGAWTALLALEPGSYRVNVRVDGGPWTAPPGLPVLPDEFGGSVGVLTISEDTPPAASDGGG